MMFAKRKRVVDERYKELVRALPCLLSKTGKCYGAVEAHHAGRLRRMGEKPDDNTCVPLCHRHHVDEWHGAMGHFKGWTKEQRAAWAAKAIEFTRNQLGSMHLEPPLVL